MTSRQRDTSYLLSHISISISFKYFQLVEDFPADLIQKYLIVLTTSCEIISPGRSEDWLVWCWWCFKLNPIKCWVLCVEWFCIGFRFYLGCKHRLEIKKFARLPCWPIEAQYLSREDGWTNERLPVFWWEIGPGWGWVNLPFLFLFQHKTSSDRANVHISVMVAWHLICDLVNTRWKSLLLFVCLEI